MSHFPIWMINVRTSCSNWKKKKTTTTYFCTYKSNKFHTNCNLTPNKMQNCHIWRHGKMSNLINRFGQWTRVKKHFFSSSAKKTCFTCPININTHHHLSYYNNNNNTHDTTAIKIDWNDDSCMLMFCSSFCLHIRRTTTEKKSHARYM